MPSVMLYENLLRTQTPVSEDTLANFPFSNAVDTSTATQAGFESGADRAIVYDFETEVSFNAFAITKQNFNTNSQYIAFETRESDSDSWAEALRLYPTTETVQLYQFDEIVCVQLKIIIANPSVDVFVSNLAIGNTLDFSEGQYVGFKSPKFASKHTLYANVTKSSELAGFIRESKPLEARIESKFITEAWMIANYQKMYDSISRYPFYFQWREDQEPFYGWVTRFNDPSYTSLNKQAFSLDVQGLV